MRALIINDTVRKAITEAITRARAKPLPLATIKALAMPDTTHLALADRPPDFKRGIASENVLIPRGYRAAISFEEQPAGLCRHLSVSVDQRGKLPSPEAVDMIAQEFGFTEPLFETSHIWTEEFEPGHAAVNMVQIVETGR